MVSAPITDVTQATRSALEARAKELAYLAQMCGMQQQPVPLAERAEIDRIQAELERRLADRRARSLK